MRSPLQRLYKTKLAFLATIFSVGGIALLVLADGANHQHGLAWLNQLPIADLGSVLFTTGLVVIAFEYLDSKDSEERATRRLRRILRAGSGTGLLAGRARPRCPERSGHPAR
jgi:hypothetical protein